MPRHLSISLSKEVTITNPLVLYRALLANKRIEPDPTQHALALHLQKLYHRLKDYTPQDDYASRLQQIQQIFSYHTHTQDAPHPIANPRHGLRRNPLFAHLFKKDKIEAKAKALTKVLTSHEAAMQMTSPRGILLHGEVGVGKSMLLDLLADCLPNAKKRRWHFSSFMLETLSRLESRRTLLSSITSSTSTPSVHREKGQEYSLLWLAKEMIEQSPILFLDEFQLPDRAASKILSGLFTIFFQLGGVLVASSNRLPEELGRGSGIVLAPRRRGWLGFGGGRVESGYGAVEDEYRGFVDVLKARCEVWEMRGGRDWRRREAEEAQTEEDDVSILDTGDSREISKQISTFRDVDLKDIASDHVPHIRDNEALDTKPEKIILPKKYLLSSASNTHSDSEGAVWDLLVQSVLPHHTTFPVCWKMTTLTVYGRTLHLPHTYDGVLYATFSSLCNVLYGPADYITIASTFHTLILDHVPVLTLAQKSEARRFITLLDALYEARCKSVIRAEAGPDGVFFPQVEKAEAARQALKKDGVNEDRRYGRSENSEGDADADAVYPETLAEIYQDQTSPFRPNISSYASSSPLQRSKYDLDEDSGFDIVPGAGHEIGRDEGTTKVDFGIGSAYTGEDERFAYKRARSRIWEMCGGRWHARGNGDGNGKDRLGWWMPLSKEIRSWEREREREGRGSDEAKSWVEGTGTGTGIDVILGESVELDDHAGLQGVEAYRGSMKGSGRS